MTDLFRRNQLDVLEEAASALGNAGQARTYVAYNYAAGQRLSYTAAAARSTAVTGTGVLLISSTRCFFRIGNSAVNATAGAGSIPLAADVPFHVALASGEFVSVIRDTVDGNLTVVPVL